MAEAYIVAATRTAGGRRGGRLRNWHPADLSGRVIDALVEQSGIDPAQVDDVVMGCVTQVGEQAFNVARQAILSSNLPETVPGVTVDRQCGSSQQAIHFAAQAVIAGSAQAVIAAGVESMTRVPMSSAYTLAHEKGWGGPMSPVMLERRPGFAYNQFKGAEMMAAKYGFSRADCDALALSSHKRAIAATESGLFAEEILSVSGVDAEGNAVPHDVDEGIRFDATPESIGAVKTVLPDGLVTAASSSQICDGSAGVLIVSEAMLKSLNVAPLARIHQMTVLGGDPVIMLETPIPATERALKAAGMSIQDIDLYEVNEAFAPVPLAWAKAIGADLDRLNVHGGAMALGHPMGASGAKLATTLIHALRQRKGRYGLQTMCEGGGLANVTIFEAL
ncbi:MAG: acetyl-CoA C-acetyltransferase [Sphingobium phenoxybenzoativorans]